MGFIKSDKRIQKINKRAHRKVFTRIVKEVTGEQMLVNLYSIAQQRQMVKMGDSYAIDTEWNKLLYAWSLELLLYLISLQDTLPSPADLKPGARTVWDYAHCVLIIHVIVPCSTFSTAVNTH